MVPRHESSPRAQVAKQAAGLGLEHPRDRNGSLVTDRYSSPGLEAALEAYRAACARAADRVREHLRALSGRLLVRLRPSLP